MVRRDAGDGVREALLHQQKQKKCYIRKKIKNPAETIKMQNVAGFKHKALLNTNLKI